MQRLIRTTVLAVLLMIFANASAQDAILRIQERAKYLQDYKALLEHGDALIRQAAIEEALNGNDAQVRSMALETALASDDEMLHTYAIRWYLTERTQIPVTLTRPQRPDPGQTYMLEVFNDLVLRNVEVSSQDEISFRATGGKDGQLIRGGMELHFTPYSRIGCTMTLRAAGGTTLAGQLACNFGSWSKKYGSHSALVARIDLS
jgi:hypothetical protein